MNLNQNPPPATPWNQARSPFIRYPSQSSPTSVVKPLAVHQRVQAKREFLEWLDKQNPELVRKAQAIVERDQVNRGGMPNVTQADNGNLGLTPRYYRFDQDMNVRQGVMRKQGMGQLPVGLGQATPWDPFAPDPWATPPISPTIPEEQAEESWLDKLIDTASNLAPAVFQTWQQKEIMDMQLERARQGLPPLDTTQMAPTIRIQTELSPETTRAAREGLTAGIGQLGFPLLVLGGVLLMTMGGRRRRR